MTNQGLLSAPKCLLGETSIEEYRRAHPRSQRGWGNTQNRRSTLSPRAARTGKARKNNQRKDKGHVIGHSPQPEPESHTRNHSSANNHTATRTTTLVPPETTFEVVLCRRKREPLSLDTEWHQRGSETDQPCRERNPRHQGHQIWTEEPRITSPPPPASSHRRRQSRSGMEKTLVHHAPKP